MDFVDIVCSKGEKMKVNLGLEIRFNVLLWKSISFRVAYGLYDEGGFFTPLALHKVVKIIVPRFV